MEKITEPFGTETPASVASSHRKVIFPGLVFPKLAGPSPGNTEGTGSTIGVTSDTTAGSKPMVPWAPIRSVKSYTLTETVTVSKGAPDAVSIENVSAEAGFTIMRVIASIKRNLQHAEIDLTMGRIFGCFIKLVLPFV
jgi:hypothetical protein